ncbi:MAG: sugar nucleotide-binding protein, partial [Pseudomonadota bacterium]
MHLAAWANPSDCERDPQAAARVNVAAGDWLAKLAAESGVPFVLASTDLVFDGRAAPYAPNAAPTPLHRYGHQKVEAEARVCARHPGAVVARLPLLYDTPIGDTSCFASELLARWSRGEATPLFEDEFRTPALARDVAAALWDLLDHAGGTVHLG